MNLCKIRILACAVLLTMPLALHAENPLYSPESKTVSIPSIDMEQMHGGYHNALLEFVREDLWRLKQITRASELASIEKVSVVKTDSFPAQIFLEIEGVVGYICAKLHLEKRLVGKTFHISIQQENGIPGAACIAIAADFSWIIPLEVYGLPAGEYQYVVNHGVGPVQYMNGGGSVNLGVGLSGSFVLAADNIFPRAAPEFPRFISPETTQVQLTPN